MKPSIAFVAVLAGLLLSSHSVFADDIRLLSGKEYKNVKVRRIEPDGITITTENGIKKIHFSKLTPDMQAKYGYDPAKEAAYIATAQQSAAAQARAKAASAAAQQLIQGTVVENTPQGVLLHYKADSGKTIHKTRYSGDKQISLEVPLYVDAFYLIKQHPNADVLPRGINITITAIPGGQEVVDGRTADVFTFVRDNTPVR